MRYERLVTATALAFALLSFSRPAAAALLYHIEGYAGGYADSGHQGSPVVYTPFSFDIGFESAQSPLTLEPRIAEWRASSFSLDFGGAHIDSFDTRGEGLYTVDVGVSSLGGKPSTRLYTDYAQVDVRGVAPGAYPTISVSFAIGSSGYLPAAIYAFDDRPSIFLSGVGSPFNDQYFYSSRSFSVTSFSSAGSTLRLQPLYTLKGVPEPATWATMIIGFGIIGVALRGRRKATSLRLFS